MNNTGIDTTLEMALKPSLAPNRWFILLLCLGTSITFHAKGQAVMNHVKDYAFINTTNAPELPWTAALGFGHAITGIGDVNGDGVPDLAIGQPAGAEGRGSVFLAFMNAGGYPDLITSIKTVEIDSLATTDSTYAFGSALASVGDLDLDGVPDIAVLAPGDDDGGPNLGAIYILYLDASGSVKATTKISALQGGFTNSGNATTRMTTIGAGGDLNGDGIPDLLVGAQDADDVGGAKGIVWGLLLNRDGTVLGQRTYSSASAWPNSNPISGSPTHFGRAVVGLGDIDGDGHADIAVSTQNPAAVFLLSMNDNGTIKAWRKVEPADLTDYDTAGEFGFSLSSEYDLDANGVQDLLIGDPSHTTNGVLCGAVVQLDVAPTTEALEYSVITNGPSMNQSELALGDNARLGHSIAQWGDTNSDGTADLVFGMPQPHDPNASQQIVVAYMQAHPIAIRFEIKDETPDSLGSVELFARGGVRPYTYYWSEELADSGKFENTKLGIDTLGLEKIGLTPPFQDTFTPHDLAALTEPVLNAVPSGLYWVAVRDARGIKLESKFGVGLEINTLVEVGASTSANKKEVTKESTDGWSNMQLATKNILPAKDDGWIRFRVPTVDKMLAVGFKDVGVTNEPGYQHMDQAFYLEGNTVRFWNGEHLLESAISYSEKDIFQLERKKDIIVFSVNNEKVYSLEPIDQGRTLTMSVSIYDQGGKVTDITTNLRSTFGLNPTVQHLDPLAPHTGGIALALHSGLGPYTCTWSATTSTDHMITGIAPGDYAVTVSSANFDNSRTRIFKVGSKLVFGPSALVATTEGIGLSITKPDSTLTGWNEHLLSTNMVRNGSGHTVAFKAYPIKKEKYGSIVGLRSGEDRKIWAGWWVFAFGQQLIAQTITRNGTAVRKLIEPTDELEIVLHTYSIHFKKNGELVHQVPRTTEAESFLIAAVYDNYSTIKDLYGTLTVPLVLNTSMLDEGVNMLSTTPSGLNTLSTSGMISKIELDHDLSAGPYSISAQQPEIYGTGGLSYHLSNGSVQEVLITTSLDTIHLDSTLFQFRAPDQLILYDEPEVYIDPIRPPFTLDLEGFMVMSPNNDQQYDQLRVNGLTGEHVFDLKVIDLQGNLLFQTADPSQGWNGQFMNNGTLVPNGIYKYTIELDGNAFAGQFMVKY